MGRGGAAGDNAAQGSFAASGGDSAQRAGAKGSPSGGAPSGEGAGRGGLKNFGQIRDSVMAAHGGQMSPEELRAEMGKVFEKRHAGGEPGRKAVAQVPATKHLAPPSGGGTKFGITQLYAQYQKSPYVPNHQSGRARIWILNAQNKLQPVFVRTGVTDGRFTEVWTDSLKPGDQIVLGATSTSEVASASPLSGGGQQRPGGPGGFR